MLRDADRRVTNARVMFIVCKGSDASDAACVGDRGRDQYLAR